MESQPPSIAQGRKAEATRSALLTAARVVIARDGYTNSKIGDIAREAGKSVGVFYSYFKDKTELFSALVDAFQDDLKRLTPAPQDYEENTAPAIKAAVAAFWATYRQFHPEMLGLLETAFADDRLLKVWQSIRKRGIRRFAFRIRKQQEKGKCSSLDPELSASALMGMLEFTCFNWHSRRLDYPDAEPNDTKAVEALYQMIAHVLELEPDRVAVRSNRSSAKAKRAR
ncbi:TetR/AcrR family transcriptional regulator [Paraburkholderia sediminicola]|nr:TetR/AcrR family transcriptional regulator [Paraburkholderia sediminicola]